MKRIMLLFFAAMTLVGCEKIETNTPALQGELDDTFFEAIDARAFANEDGSYNILGVNQDEALTLHIRKAQLGTYPLGEGQLNYATFEDANGNLYSTNPYGDGEIVLTDRCLSCGFLTGTFRFNAVLPGIDTITAQKGIFFEVRFPIAGDDGSQDNAGTFTAEVDGTPFTPFNVNASNTGNNIVILGASTSTSISLRFPSDLVAGIYELPMGGFVVSYTNGAITEAAESGEIIIENHDPATQTIKGTFSFETASTSITLGQFNVTYQ